MNENSYSSQFLSDFLADDESMRRLRSSFAQCGEGMNYETFKATLSAVVPVFSPPSLAQPSLNSPSSPGVGSLPRKERKVTVAIQATPPRERQLSSTQLRTQLHSHVSRTANVGTKRWLRKTRQRSMNELAGLADVEPLKELFNHINRRNQLLISFDDVVEFLSEELRNRTSCVTETSRSYSFSRKMVRNKVEVSWLIGHSAEASQQRAIQKGSTKSVSDPPPIQTAWESFVPPVVVPEIVLIHFIHGLPGHQMFALSTRLTPLALYYKASLQHARTFSEEELGSTRPTLVEFLPVPDTILSYSVDDASLRGWTYLLSKNNSTSLLPLRIDGKVQRMRTSPYFPYSVFLGTTSGKIVRVEVPSLRSGTELKISQVFENLHDIASAGVVDFAISDTHIFTTGFDHRLLSINIQSGNVTVIGSCIDVVYLVEYCELSSLVLGVSYKNELLAWDAKGLVAVPGTVFSNALEKEHYHRIQRLICVKDFPHCLTVDSSGVVKMWDFRKQQCIQTTKADGTSTEAVDPKSVYGLKGENSITKGNSMINVIDVAYFDEYHELVCCTTDCIYLLQHNLREDVYLCDFDQVKEMFYDVREKSFILQGPTRVSVWDVEGGFRKRLMDRALKVDIPPAKKDICSFCVDDVGSRIFIAVSTGDVEVHDIKEIGTPVETFHTTRSITQMVFSNFYKSLVGITEEGVLMIRNEEERTAMTVNMRMSSSRLYSLSISDCLGLVACCDDSGFLFLHDIKKVENPSQLCSVNSRIICCKLLGSIPILASTHDAGDLCLWSCPPIVEVFVQLAVYNVATQLRADNFLRYSVFAQGDNHGVPVRRASPSPRRQHHSTADPSHATSCNTTSRHTPFSSRLVAELFDRNEKAKEDITVRNSAAGPDDRRIRDGYEVTALAFDDNTHRLFCGDNSGTITIVCLCPLLHSLHIKATSFEVNNAYFLGNPNLTGQEYSVVFMATVPAHSGSVISLLWVSYENVLLTSGSDRKSLLFDSDGVCCGVLSKARLPSSVKKPDERRGSLHSLTKHQHELPAYSLPRREPKPEGEECDDVCTHEALWVEPAPEEEDKPPLVSSETSNCGVSLRFGDFLKEEGSQSFDTLENESRNNRRGFLKQRLIGTKAERNNKLAEVKVDFFPSTVRCETLCRLEESRPHSSHCEVQPPVLFACESEPTNEAKCLKLQQSLRHDEYASLTSCGSGVVEKEKPFIIPKLPSVTRPTSKQASHHSPHKPASTSQVLPFSPFVRDAPHMHTKVTTSMPNGRPRSFGGTQQRSRKVVKSALCGSPSSTPSSPLDSLLTEYDNELQRCITTGGHRRAPQLGIHLRRANRVFT